MLMTTAGALGTCLGLAVLKVSSDWGSRCAEALALLRILGVASFRALPLLYSPSPLCPMLSSSADCGVFTAPTGYTATCTGHLETDTCTMSCATAAKPNPTYSGTSIPASIVCQPGGTWSSTEFAGCLRKWSLRGCCCAPAAHGFGANAFRSSTLDPGCRRLPNSDYACQLDEGEREVHTSE